MTLRDSVRMPSVGAIGCYVNVRFGTTLSLAILRWHSKTPSYRFAVEGSMKFQELFFFIFKEFTKDEKGIEDQLI